MKKTITLLTSFLLISLMTVNAQGWTQIGSIIEGEDNGSKLGTNIEVNSDGSIVAIGSWGNDNQRGIVKVFQKSDGTWSQVGANIEGETDSDWAHVISLNSDGTILAVGAPYNDGNGQSSGQVKIYENISGNWVQIGNSLYGDDALNFFGRSVSLSSDGTILAVGAPNNGLYSGQVKIYKDISGAWVQVGNSIYGEAFDQSGISVSLNSDGSIVAIGASDNDGSATNAGCVRIYQNIAEVWTQIGSNIEGDEAQDNFGFVVSLNSNGSIVAIGSPHYDGYGHNDGVVKVYQNIADTWTQMGGDLYEIGGWIGYDLDLDASGSIVALRNTDYGDHQGKMSIYKYIEGSWILDVEIIGEENDYLSSSVCISSDGKTVAIGAVQADPETGYGVVYDYLIFPTITSEPSNQTDICLGDETIFTITGEDIINYQWEESVDGNTWSDLTNNSIYSGVYTNTLTITTELNLNNNYYRCNLSNEDGNTISNTVSLILDIENPIITSTHVDQFIGNGVACEIILPDYTGSVTATDNCDTSLDIIQSPVAGVTIAGVTNEITLTVTDDLGNTDQAIFNVEVTDNIDPEITSTHNNQTIDADNNCEINLPDYTGNIIAIDNCDSNLDITQNPTAGSIISGETNEITLTVTDDTGNTNEVIFNIEVVDNTAPEVTSTHNDQTVDAGIDCEANIPDYTGSVIAIDNCDMNLDITQFPTASSTISGTTNEVTLTVTDDEGNYTEVSFNVEVEDNIDPEITSTHTNQSIGDGVACEANLPNYIEDVIANDNCDSELEITQSPTAGTIITGLTNTITLTVTDNAGNYAVVSFNVVVIDTTNPYIECTDDLTVYLNEGQNIYYVTDNSLNPLQTIDNCGISNVSNSFNSSSTLNGAAISIGNTEIIWTIEDNAGNTSNCSFVIIVNEFSNIQTLQQNGISIYPNPTNRIINFEFADNNIQQIVISDLTGKTIIEKINIQQHEMIDLSSFESGIYIIKIQTDNEIFTTKIVKE